MRGYLSACRRSLARWGLTLACADAGVSHRQAEYGTEYAQGPLDHTQVVQAAPAQTHASGPEGLAQMLSASTRSAWAHQVPRVLPRASRTRSVDSKPHGAPHGAASPAGAPKEAPQLPHPHAASLTSALAGCEVSAHNPANQSLPRAVSRVDELAATKTAFCLHQIEVCLQFESYVHQFYTPLRTVALVDASEMCATLDPIRALAQLHRALLERLQRDSDMVGREPLAQSQFCFIVHDVFSDMRGPFKIYIENFDSMFEMLTKWKATVPQFAKMLQELQERDNKNKLNLASCMALPLSCLKTYQEILQQYRHALLCRSTHEDSGTSEVPYVDETLLSIRTMRDLANVHGATDQAVKALLSIERKMVSLAACDTEGAVISIVKLGRSIVHIGSLRVLGMDEEDCAEYTGYLFSDVLVCCGGHKGGLVARLIVDLKMAEVEPYDRPWQGSDGSMIPAHAFGVHQTDRRAPGHERSRSRIGDVTSLTLETRHFAASDAASRNVWLAQLHECLSSLAAARLRMPPLRVDEIQRLRRVNNDLIHELGLFGSASDTTEDAGRYGTSASDSEWDVEDDIFFYDALDRDEREESGLMAGLRKARENNRLKGLTADMPQFQRVLEQKLQLLSVQFLSGRTSLEELQLRWGRGDESPDWDPSDVEDEDGDDDRYNC